MARRKAPAVTTTREKNGHDGMSCASCVGRVERALEAVEGVHDVSANLAGEAAQMEIAEGAGFDRFAAALADVSYPPRVPKAALVTL